MQARVVPLAVQPGKLEELVDYFAGERTAQIREAPGNRAFFVLTEPATNQALLLSVWESAEAAVASQSLFQAMTGEFGALLTAPPTPTRYDVRIGG
jgi:heme-degrading monooxygenase HmoA